VTDDGGSTPHPVEALADRYWEAFLALHPISATLHGDERYDDRLDETTSPGFREKTLAVDRAFLDRAHAIDAARLSPKARLSVANATTERELALDFREVYESRFHDVLRWIRAMGGREEDLDDLAQEVFIIVRRKLTSFDGQNLNGWLYRITQRTVRDYRRAAWFRNLLLRKKVPDHEGTLLKLVEPGRDPAQEQELREAQRSLRLVLSRMREKHRTAFVLFEIEGYTGEEIAALEGAPVATVFTRLYHARREFAAIIKQLNEEQKLL